MVLSDDRTGGGELVLNAESLRFSTHWGFVARSCRAYRAQTNGKVERPFRHLRESFFYGREFANDADLNAQASRWLEGTANVRVHGTTGERPVDRFERDERAVLLRLAGQPYRRLGAATPAAPAPGSGADATSGDRIPPQADLSTSPAQRPEANPPRAEGRPWVVRRFREWGDSSPVRPLCRVEVADRKLTELDPFEG